MKKHLRGITALAAAALLAVSVTGCGSGSTAAADGSAIEAGSEVQAAGGSALSEAETVQSSVSGSTAQSSVSGGTAQSSASESSAQIPTAENITFGEEMEDTSDGGHVIEADGTQESYANILVAKTGDSDSGDEADFYGDNAAVFATNGASLDLSEMLIQTDGTHANAVFSYGEGTVVNISDSVIETAGNCSGGLMTTGGGTMNASNLNIHTTGNSSAAIRSDRGGGTVNVTGGSYTTDGTGSPVIYSTADITVSDAEMTSTASQGVVVEGKNSVTLNNVNLTADNNTKNSDKSDWYQAVMIYQSMSGDAAEGLASFAMNGGSLINKNGDVFFVNNTVAEILLNGTEITNEGDGMFLRAAAAGWGSEGSNGGQVTLTADAQEINGNMLADEVSSLNLYLQNGSAFTGAINPDGAAGEVYVELTGGSVWTLTGDSYVTALTCGEDSIDLNGFKLYVNGEEYEEGTAAQGDAIEVTVSSAGGNGGPGGQAPPDGQGGPGGNMNGQPPEKPYGNGPDGSGNAPSDGMTPPEIPGGNANGQPPEKPDGSSSGN